MAVKSVYWLKCVILNTYQGYSFERSQDEIKPSSVDLLIGGDDYQSDLDDMLNKSRSGSEDSNASNALTEASLLSQASTLASTLITEHATTGKQLDFGELEKLVTDLGTGEGAVTRLKGFLATIREDDKFKDLPKIKGNNFKSAEKDFKTIIKGSPLYIE